MTQAELDRAVARATGESVATVRRLGFQLEDLFPEDFDDLDGGAKRSTRDRASSIGMISRPFRWNAISPLRHEAPWPRNANILSCGAAGSIVGAEGNLVRVPPSGQRNGIRWGDFRRRTPLIAPCHRTMVIAVERRTTGRTER